MAELEKALLKDGPLSDPTKQELIACLTKLKYTIQLLEQTVRAKDAKIEELTERLDRMDKALGDPLSPTSLDPAIRYMSSRVRPPYELL
jgi:predicted RNase H-like nuclease (RuvC/YqgF family)